MDISARHLDINPHQSVSHRWKTKKLYLPATFVRSTTKVDTQSRMTSQLPSCSETNQIRDHQGFVWAGRRGQFTSLSMSIDAIAALLPIKLYKRSHFDSLYSQIFIFRSPPPLAKSFPFLWNLTELISPSWHSSLNTALFTSDELNEAEYLLLLKFVTILVSQSLEYHFFEKLQVI